MNSIYQPSLRLLRKSKNLTLKELSGITGISFQKLSEMERGLCPVSDEYICGIEKALGISLVEDSFEDRLILDYYEKFLDVLFNGYSDITPFEEEINKLKTECNESKYNYYISVFEFVINCILYQNYDDSNVPNNITDDKRIGSLYMIYKSYKYIDSNYRESIRILDESMIMHMDYRLRAIAQYQKCYVYIRNFKIYEALSAIRISKLLFMKGSAYVRMYSCDYLTFKALLINSEYKSAIEIADQCLNSAEKLSLSSMHRSLIYRSIGLAYILNRDYDKAIDYLNKSAIDDDKNEELILEYIYAYSLAENYKEAEKWIKKGSIIIKGKNNLIELKYWINFNRFINSNPDKIIVKTDKIINYYFNKRIHDAYIFYMDIKIMLLERYRRYKEAFIEQKNKENHIIQLKNS